MKDIQLVISYKDGNVGGHFYTLLNYYKFLSFKGYKCTIVVIGNSNPEIFSTLNVDVMSFRLINKNRRGINSSYAVLTFDNPACTIIRLISINYKINLVNILCGGPNPNNYYLTCNKQICLSFENYEYLKRKRKFDCIKLIPNRVYKNKDVGSHRPDIFENNSQFKILTISRIGNRYFKKLEQSVNLYDLLVEKGFSVELVIIGYIENDEVYQLLLDKASRKAIKIYTEDKYTNKASDFIGQADSVIGTGRGFMEAALQQKIMFCPVDNLKYPSFVNYDNVAELSSKNFSGRSVLDDKIEYDNLCRLDLDNSILNYYEENFNIEYAFNDIKEIIEYKSNVNKNYFLQVISLIYLFFNNVKAML
ncbi:hypothetical protein [Vibrio splendidus]|uniref:hypothetical protein n=1 Tax=Vibrio splendidus TaxID=29497 RepID=UPI00148D24B0|nr:hypothetical protein [Vibrio splendidus]NOJ10045.1 hypothetical protein [Vibrio splendidus]